LTFVGAAGLAVGGGMKMSYDLLVFDPAAAPRDREAFMLWYDEQTQWSEPHGYNDPAETMPALAAWYAEIERGFPNSQGPAAFSGDGLSPRLTDYSIGRSIIYACFRWSEAEPAYEAVRGLAIKHGVGFFNASGDDAEILFPSLQ
jgi:hypothetical protein